MNTLKHVAIIMDGNGRWAQKQQQKRIFGHYVGSEQVRTIALQALDMGIEVLTLYAFSTENWKRPLEEIEYLMKLPAIFFERFLSELMEKGIRIETIGDLSKVPDKTRKVMEDAVQRTKDNKRLVLNFALNYGSRDEIVRAVNRILKSDQEEIDEATFNAYLDTKELPEVDLLIRTGGDKRMSNFLLWQCAYAELVFVDEAWPQFSPELFAQCVNAFFDKERRFGGLV